MDPSDPKIRDASLGLAGYLGELVRAAEPLNRTARGLDSWWLAELPNGVSLPTTGRNGLLLALDLESSEHPPAPPSVFEGRIDGGWSDPTVVPKLLRPQHPEPAPEGMPMIEVPTGLGAKRFDEWLARWTRWAESETARQRRESLRENSRPPGSWTSTATPKNWSSASGFSAGARPAGTKSSATYSPLRPKSRWTSRLVE